MYWKYAYEPCMRPRGPYDQYVHDSPHLDASEMPEDRLEMMWCPSCEAYLWGIFTITETP